ncbi:hypothetical protein Rsub_04457 [Raphidocelis subcapitata]|uniref:U3 small nucleolar RNA-associated protein 25 n=1 Tax=Raphidocelis subcapitata TaxID=307507 RepID=A0A2V0P2N9_9CHLO|nr:hypothetical protein Rsub_04457 [Raphidocelis subcapitata]|eukprot:GBF92110.1 hypothetical protein Rsub_04457 [Raphidocelis subcapitata]
MSRLAAVLLKKKAGAGAAPAKGSGAGSGGKKRKQRNVMDDLAPAAPLAKPPAAGDDLDSDEDRAGEAYNELVGLLARQDKALRRRQQQEGGDSDADGSSSSDEDEDEQAEPPQRRRLDERGRRSQQPRRRGREEEEEAQQQEEEEEEEEDGEQQQQQEGEEGSDEGEEQQAPDGGGADAAAAHGAAAPAGGEPGMDAWAAHLGRELSEAEAAALRAGGTKFSDPSPSEADAAYDGAWPRARWQLAGRAALPAAPSGLAEYGVKERLRARWEEVHQEDARRAASGALASTSAAAAADGAAARKKRRAGGAAAGAAARCGDFDSAQQRGLFALLNSYCDVLHACKPYPQDAAAPDPDLDAVLLHCLNHVAKSADLVKRNNERLKGQPGGQSGGQIGGLNGAAAAADAAPPRDQGFTRAKVLLLLPQRNLAFRAVRRLVALAQKEARADSVQGKEKFVEQFGGDEEEGAGGGGGGGAGGSGGGGGDSWRRKPAEHRALFAGDTDDHFRMGIKITRGQIKLFSDLLSSDIVVASPVAIATKLAEERAASAAGGGGGRGGGGRGGGGRGGGRGAAASRGRGRGRDGGGAGGAGGGGGAGGESDFLSSIEIAVVERADVMTMQNFDHVVTVLDALNKLPQQQHGNDIMRVREWYLTGRAALYRQTIVTSSFASPDLMGILSKRCLSHAGKARLVAQPAGVLSQIVPQLRQTFERFGAASAAQSAEARMAHFKAAVWPRLQEGAAGGGLLLFVPQYFDFVRIRNFLKSEEAEFMAVSEYTPYNQVTRARSLFCQRRTPLLLYTERAHFYHRYRIRGVQDVVFYGLPEHAHFYSEILNLLEGSAAAAPAPGAATAAEAEAAAAAAAASAHGTVTALFCRFDALALGRVVGAARAGKMLAAESSTFLFV